MPKKDSNDVQFLYIFIFIYSIYFISVKSKINLKHIRGVVIFNVECDKKNRLLYNWTYLFLREETMWKFKWENFKNIDSIWHLKFDFSLFSSKWESFNVLSIICKHIFQDNWYVFCFPGKKMFTISNGVKTTQYKYKTLTDVTRVLFQTESETLLRHFCTPQVRIGHISFSSARLYLCRWAITA